MAELAIGIKGSGEITVCEKDTAKVVGSGDLDVLATPVMISLFEKTAAESVRLYMEEGMTTVGIKLDAEHVSATPVGMKVYCKSVLAAIEGRKLVFEVEASDEAGLIGKAIHERFIVNAEKFMSRANAKSAK